MRARGRDTRGDHGDAGFARRRRGSVALAVASAPAFATVARGIADPTLTQPGARIAPAVQAAGAKSA